MLAAALADPAAAQLAEADRATRAAQAHERDMGATGHHGLTYSFAESEFDFGRADAEDQATWDVQAWRGGDHRKLWLKSEGDIADGEPEQAELQVLYSRNVGTFFDAQLGLRYDWEPASTAYLAAGVQGLAPYFLETEAAAFLSEDGDVSLRLKQSADLLLTQRLILEPYVEADANLTERPERSEDAGLTAAEAGLQVRYEITRKFAPYVDLLYERAFGRAADRRELEGEDAGGWRLRVGLRSWF
jgi:copper resistance protein B